MAKKLKLIDVTKLPKASHLVLQESKAVIAESEAIIEQQQQFYAQQGIDWEALKQAIHQKDSPFNNNEKLKEALAEFKAEFQRDLNDAAQAKRKALKSAEQLFNKKKHRKKPRRARSSRLF